MDPSYCLGLPGASTALGHRMNGHWLEQLTPSLSMYFGGQVLGDAFIVGMSGCRGLRSIPMPGGSR